MTTEQTNSIIKILAEDIKADIKAGVTPSVVEARMINAGAPKELAAKITRLVEVLGRGRQS